MEILRTATDNLYLYDPQFLNAAKKFIADVGGGAQMRAISKSHDLTEAFYSYTSVKFLIFDTHGAPGRVALSDGTKLKGMDIGFKCSNNQFLSNDSRILFYGCSIGEGTAGDIFMDDIGRYMLVGKGGIVGVSTSVTTTFTFGSESWLDPTKPTSAKLKVRRYDISGAVIASKTVNRWGK